MPHALYRTEAVAGGDYARAKRYSFIKMAFRDYDTPCRGKYFGRAERSWKKFRKTQYKACNEVIPEI